MRIHSLEELRSFAEEILAALPHTSGATVLALVGELGAGKTAFVKALAETLGVTETVTSPTFVIEKIYKLDGQRFSHLVHIDAYRLEGEQELGAIGWNELIQNVGNLICVEWADRIHGALPADARTLHFTFIDEATREIT